MLHLLADLQGRPQLYRHRCHQVICLQQHQCLPINFLYSKIFDIIAAPGQVFDKIAHLGNIPLQGVILLLDYRGEGRCRLRWWCRYRRGLWGFIKAASVCKRCDAFLIRFRFLFRGLTNRFCFYILFGGLVIRAGRTARSSLDGSCGVGWSRFVIFF